MLYVTDGQLTVAIPHDAHHPVKISRPSTTRSATQLAEFDMNVSGSSLA